MCLQIGVLGAYGSEKATSTSSFAQLLHLLTSSTNLQFIHRLMIVCDYNRHGQLQPVQPT